MLDPDKRAGALSSIVEAQFSKTIGFTKLRGNYLLIYAWTQEERTILLDNALSIQNSWKATSIPR